MSLKEYMQKKKSTLTAIVLGAMIAGCSQQNTPTTPAPDGNQLVGGAGTPAINVSYVPPIGNGNNITGKVNHVIPNKTIITGYIYVPGENWWIKPYASPPYWTINHDGSFSFPYDTGGIDQEATTIELYLLPLANESQIPIVEYAISPPDMSGVGTEAQTIISRQ